LKGRLPRWRDSVTTPPQASIEPLRRALSTIGLTRQLAGLDFLLDLVRTESPPAEAAIDAILRSMPAPEITQQLESMVSSSPRLACAFTAHRAAS